MNEDEWVSVPPRLLHSIQAMGIVGVGDLYDVRVYGKADHPLHKAGFFLSGRYALMACALILDVSNSVFDAEAHELVTHALKDDRPLRMKDVARDELTELALLRGISNLVSQEQTPGILCAKDSHLLHNENGGMVTWTAL